LERSNRSNAFIYLLREDPMAHRGNVVCLAGLLAWGWAAPGWGQEPEAFASPTPAHTFGRGFDLDRGIDFSVTLGGIPANLSSTVWGPGYLDTGVWIPELEGDVQRARGPHRADQDGFAIAGSASRDLGPVANPSLTAEYGGAEADRFGRLVWLGSRPVRGATFTGALEATRTSRPWDELDPSSKFNGAFRLGREARDRGWNVTVLATRENGDGGAPDPLRAEEDADELHEGDGLRTRRLLLGAGLRRENASGVTTRFQVYGGVSTMSAWGDYTYFLRDAERGDQLERVDRRQFLGLEASRRWPAWRGPVGEWDLRAGLQARVDCLGAAEVFATQDRARFQPLMRGQADLYQQALYGQAATSLGAGWRASLGWRLDAQSNHVDDTAPGNPGNRSGALLSPKLGLAYRPGPDTEFSLDHGGAARPGNAFRDPQPLTRITGTDLGVRTRVLGPWTSGVTLWTLDLQAETGLDPRWDAYVAQGRSRRQGLEWHNVVRQGPWDLELSLDWTHARFRDLPHGQDHVPGALGQTGLLAVGWKGASRAVKVSWKRAGAYALTADNSVLADPQDSVELKLTQAWRDWTFSAGVLNLFSLRKYNQEYFYLSRLNTEPAGVWDRHVRKADPQAVRFEITRRF
jgi:hypothetical protein